jgi:hypothetical protein
MLAAAGAVGGFGQGVVEAGEQAQKEQLLQKQNDLATARDATLQRLRAAEEEKLQGSQQTFQHGEKQTEYGVMAKSAAAHADLLKEIANANIQGRHADVSSLVAGRISVQDSKNRGAAAVADKRAAPQSEYKPGKATLNSPGVDAFKKPIPGKEMDVQIHHDGSKWVQGPAGNLFPFDPSKPGGYDPTPRGRPSAQDTSALLQNPLGTLPSGTSTRDYFVSKFGSLPPAYLGAANAARTNMNATRASQPQTPSANTNEEDQDERDDDNVALGGDPYGTKGNVPSSSPEDNEPAQ